MTWVRLDDRFPFHPKAIAAGPLGRDLFVCGLAYCNLHLTDGFIPTGAIHTLAPGLKQPLAVAARLVEVRLWEKREGGWQVHDYQDWNRSTNEVRELVEMRRAAGRLGGKRSAEARRKQRASQAPEATIKHDGVGATQPISSPINPLIPPEASASSNGRHPWPPGASRDTRWTPASRWPYEAFNHDCPEPAWRGHCVAASWAQEHPGQHPVDTAGAPKQCPAHRTKAIEA